MNVPDRSASLPVPWRLILRNNYTRWEALVDFLELTSEQRKAILPRSHFPLNLPSRLAAKIAKGTLDDPILKQFLPTQQETHSKADFMVDPVGDQVSRCGGKLLHKYAGRALLICTSSCAMHCRYCFRQHFNYEVGVKGFAVELDTIRQDASISEVILSGGDPLSLSDETLEQLLSDLSSIPHIQRIRFHTRFPIGIPERITPSFLSILQKSQSSIWFVIHVNHANELDEEILESLGEIQKLGIPILCQSVLLRDVNDNLHALKTLCERLINKGILPYYLHQLDRVQGAEHFEVSEAEGKWLVQELAKVLPGYAVPRYVKEVAGEPTKIPL